MKSLFNPLNVRVGLIAGLAIVTYSVIGFLAFDESAENMGTLEVLGYLRYVILLIGVFVGMRLMAQKSEVPYSYLQAIIPGIAVALIAAAWVGIMEAAYLVINPEFYDTYAQYYLENLQLGGASETELEAAKAQMESFSWMANPLASGVFYFIETFLIGGIGALIMGFFFQKKGTLVTA